MGGASSTSQKANDPNIANQIAQQTAGSTKSNKQADPVASPPVTKPKPVDDSAEEVNFKAIHSAFRWNKPPEEIEHLLISADAVNIADPNNGNRPIHIAAQNGHNELVKLLIRKKADLNVKNAKGNTGLHMSIGYDYYDTSMLLINAGADQEMLNESGFPAKFGLEGNKALGIAGLVCAKHAGDVLESFQLCREVITKLDRVNFVQAGLKAKKTIGSAWSADLQDQFKEITNKLNAM
jgi:ankyrin repeat protein